MAAATTDVSPCELNNNADALFIRKNKEAFNRIISCEYETLNEYEKTLANDLYRLSTHVEALDEQKTPMMSMLINDEIIDVYDTDECSDPKLVAKL